MDEIRETFDIICSGRYSKIKGKVQILLLFIKHVHCQRSHSITYPLIVFDHIGLHFNQKKEVENQRDFITVESTIYCELSIGPFRIFPLLLQTYGYVLQSNLLPNKTI
jgi:hypothetical protein